MIHDPLIQQIAELCDRYEDSLVAGFIFGSRVLGPIHQQSDYDLLFVFNDKVEFGVIKLLYLEFRQLSPLLDINFISLSQAEEGLYFSHPQFVDLRGVVDHGVQIWGKNNIDLCEIDVEANRKARLWWAFLLIRVFELDFWPVHEWRSKRAQRVIVDLMAVEPQIPSEHLGAFQNLVGHLPEQWPEACGILSHIKLMDDREFKQAFLSFVKPVFLAKLLRFKDFTPKIYKNRFHGEIEFIELSLLTEAELKLWNQLSFGSFFQVSDFIGKV